MTYEYTDPTGDKVDIKAVRLGTPNGVIDAISVRPEGSSFYIAADQVEEFVTGVRGLTSSEMPSTETLIDLISDFLDPDGCVFDHHGYCQAHMWFETNPACPHGRARQLLAAADAELPSS